MNEWAEERQGTLALLRTIIGFGNLLIASIITLRVFGVIWMDGLLEIIVLISLLFTVAIYIQLWMRNEQIDKMDLIISQFYDMFFNAYQVISEEELQHIMNTVAPVKDNKDLIKEWDEGN